MQNAYKLYGRPGSGSIAVQVALEEAHVPYERVWVGEEPADLERYRAVNPTGKVPALVLPDATPMFESAAMLIHLALAHPQAKLSPPAGSARHALFLQWMVFLSANLYESVLRIYYSARYSTRGEADAEVISRKGREDFLAHAAVMQPSLRPFLLGEEYSIADAYLYMLAGWYPDQAELAARVPPLAEHALRVKARPAVAKVAADHATGG